MNFRSAKLLLIRHGESTWNLEQRFTGWCDVGLTPRGEQQIREAGEALRATGIVVDRLYASLLHRCIRSADILLEAAGAMGSPRTLDWRLNERHYGALTGLLKAQAVALYGEAAVQAWRRSYRAVPPPCDHTQNQLWTHDSRYGGIRSLPTSESLMETEARVCALWAEGIRPSLVAGETVVVVGHGNSLRALVKVIEQLPEHQMSGLEIGNAEIRFYVPGTGAWEFQHIWRPQIASPLSDIL